MRDTATDGLRISLLWKRIAEALEKQADGRVRPVRPWTELEAPGGEEPEEAIADIKPEPEPQFEEPTEQLSESEHTIEPSTEEVDAKDSEIPGEIGESLLLDPSERARIVDLFQRWDPKFLAEEHKTSGVPDELPREQTMALRAKEEIQRELNEADKKLAEARKSKFPPLALIKRLESERDYAIRRMDDFLKKWGAEAVESERLRHLENLSEGETAEERKQTAPYQFPGEFEKSPEDAASAEKADKALRDFEAAGGLAGQLLSKSDSSLSKAERGNLGSVLDGFVKLLSKNELRGSLEQERKLVRKIVTTLRKLTDKFSDAIKKDRDLSGQMSDVASALDRAIQSEESARQSALESWHGHDAVKIAIAARLQVQAGGRSQSLRDRHIGKRPIRTKSPTYPYSLPDISTGVSGYSPTNAFESLILDNEQLRAILSEAALAALNEPGSSDAAVESAARKSYEIIGDEYKEFYWKHHGRFEGTLTEKNVAYDPATPESEGRPESPREMPTEIDPSTGAPKSKESWESNVEDLFPQFFSEYAVLAESVIASIPQEDEPEAEADELIGVTSVEPSKSESVELSEEEKAAKSKDVEEARAKSSAPLERGALYDQDGELKDIQVLYTDLPEDRHGELRNLIEDEIDSLEAKAELSELERDNLGYLKDSLEQLGRMVGGKMTTKMKKFLAAQPSAKAAADKAHEEIVRVVPGWEAAEKWRSLPSYSPSIPQEQRGLVSHLGELMQRYSKLYKAYEDATTRLDAISESDPGSPEHAKILDYWLGTWRELGRQQVSLFDTLNQLKINVKSEKAEDIENAIREHAG